MSDTPLKSKGLHSTSRVQLIVVMALVVGVGIGAVAVGFAGNSRQLATTASPATRQEAVSDLHKVGDTIEKSNVGFGVARVTTDEAGDAVYKPNPGNKFVVVDISVDNNTSSQRPVVPVTQVYLKDQTGNTYFISPAPMQNPLNAGNLVAGDNLKGQLSFEVPKDAKNLKLYFDPGWDNVSPFVFSLN